MQVELGVIEALYVIFPYGQVMATLAASAFAPAGDYDLGRNILETVRHQSLLIRGKFDPSAAVVAINKAIQKGKESKPSLDSDKIARVPAASSPPCP